MNESGQLLIRTKNCINSAANYHQFTTQQKEFHIWFAVQHVSIWHLRNYWLMLQRAENIPLTKSHCICPGYTWLNKKFGTELAMALSLMPAARLFNARPQTNWEEMFTVLNKKKKLFTKHHICHCCLSNMPSLCIYKTCNCIYHTKTALHPKWAVKSIDDILLTRSIMWNI